MCACVTCFVAKPNFSAHPCCSCQLQYYLTHTFFQKECDSRGALLRAQLSYAAMSSRRYAIGISIFCASHDYAGEASTIYRAIMHLIQGEDHPTLPGCTSVHFSPVPPSPLHHLTTKKDCPQPCVQRSILHLLARIALAQVSLLVMIQK